LCPDAGTICVHLLCACFSASTRTLSLYEDSTVTSVYYLLKSPLYSYFFCSHVIYALQCSRRRARTNKPRTTIVLSFAKEQPKLWVKTSKLRETDQNYMATTGIIDVMLFTVVMELHVYSLRLLWTAVRGASNAVNVYQPRPPFVNSPPPVRRRASTVLVTGALQ